MFETCPTECMELNHPGAEHDEDQCACSHWPHQHDPEAAPFACMVCGDNTRCDYASPEEIAADRWDEGWHAAVLALNPYPGGDGRRLLWAVDHMPEDNPYRATSAAPEPVTPETDEREGK